MHSPSFGFAPFMIIPAEMQNPVYEQRGDLLIERPMPFTSLADRRRDTDHHVSQWRGNQVSSPWRPCIARRKRQHIGRPILLTKLHVQSAHPPISHECHAHVRRGFADG
jgi:hypothetical protein